MSRKNYRELQTGAMTPRTEIGAGLDKLLGFKSPEEEAKELKDAEFKALAEKEIEERKRRILQEEPYPTRFPSEEEIQKSLEGIREQNKQMGIEPISLNEDEMKNAKLQALLKMRRGY